MSDTDPAGAAREEAARQAVYIAAMALAIPLLVWLERAAASPDTMRAVRMRAAKHTERAAAHAAGVCWQAAERARLAYERGSA